MFFRAAHSCLWRSGGVDDCQLCIAFSWLQIRGWDIEDNALKCDIFCSCRYSRRALRTSQTASVRSKGCSFWAPLHNSRFQENSSNGQRAHHHVLLLLPDTWEVPALASDSWRGPGILPLVISRCLPAVQDVPLSVIPATYGHSSFSVSIFSMLTAKAMVVDHRFMNSRPHGCFISKWLHKPCPHTPLSLPTCLPVKL